MLVHGRVLMAIIAGIHRVDEASNNMAHSNVYLIIQPNELIVVDTGTPGNAKKIVDYIQNWGITQAKSQPSS